MFRVHLRNNLLIITNFFFFISNKFKVDLLVVAFTDVTSLKIKMKHNKFSENKQTIIDTSKNN